MTYSVALFHTVSAALRAEKLLGKTELKTKLIPTPRQLSSDCGVALRFETAHRQDIENLLNQARLEAEFHDLA